jgi:quinolinate synthase
MQWAYERGEKILFLPDQHLGRNIGVKLGIPLEAMVVWDPHRDCGGLTEGQIRDSRLLLWRGHCSVHQRFSVEQIEKARAQYPDVRVVVHPECRYEVVQAADDSGSTEYIIRVVTAGEPNTTWAIGTEIHLVNRLAQEQLDKTVFCLDDCVCFCATMYRIDPPHLLWALENLREGRVVNQITVPEDTAHWARVALDRMLALK